MSLKFFHFLPNSPPFSSFKTDLCRHAEYYCRKICAQHLSAARQSHNEGFMWNPTAYLHLCTIKFKQPPYFISFSMTLIPLQWWHNTLNMFFSATTPSALELRQYRKMTPKKRILERNIAEQPMKKAPRVTLSPSAIATKNSQKPLKKRIRKVTSKQEDEEEAMDDEMADGASGGGGGGGSNGMTLEQFTEIVLASEGMAAAAAAAASVAVPAAPSTSCGQEMRLQRLPIIAHRCAHAGNGEEDKESIRPPSEDDLVANLIENNNDLIVEMKPMRPKPVVLSPRQPPGSHLLPYAHNPNPSLSTSVVVSVKPRLCNQPPSGSSASQLPRLPPSKPQNIQRMMEEWFSKMQPPIAEQALPALANVSSTSSAAAINLSTKSPKDCSSAPKGLSQTTQVYPRPITTPPKLSSPTSTSSGNSSLPIQKYNLEKRSALARNVPATAVTSNKMEIKEMEDKLFHREQHQNGSGKVSFSRQISNTTCSETQIQLQDARLRALRDVEMALTRDMHGNL